MCWHGICFSAAAARGREHSDARRPVSGGLFGAESYASRGSATERELVIEQAFVVDEDAVVHRDIDGVPVLQGLGGRLRIKEADILFLRVEPPR